MKKQEINRGGNKTSLKKEKSIPSKAIPLKARENLFLQFLKEKSQRNELLVLTLLFFVLHLVIYYLYPTPCAYYDTNNYLQCADSGRFGGYRPFGFSWLLIFIKYFSSTTYALYFFQYLVHYLTSMFFVFTVKYIFKPTTAVTWIFYALIILAPSVLYMTNYALSDSVFISLTCFWITTGMWIIYNKSIPAIIFHCASLFALIEVRYSGLFYPVVSIFLFIYSYRPWKGIALAMIPFLSAVYLYTSTKNKMNEIVQVKVFSGFAGWQLANNALHMIPYIHLREEELPDAEMKLIHQYVKALPDSVYRANGLTANYIWEVSYPLKQYFLRKRAENNMLYLRAWVFTSKQIGRYGSFLIRKFPLQFARYYLLPNIVECAYPHNPEALREYTTIPVDNTWFIQSKFDYHQPRYDLYHLYFSSMIPFISIATWCAFFTFMLIGLIKRKKIRWSPRQQQIVLFLFVFLASYLAFNIYAGPFAYRYVLPLHIIQVCLPLMILTGMRAGKAMQENNESKGNVTAISA